MYTQTIQSPIWDLTLLADDTHLLLLEFSDSEELDEKIKKIEYLKKEPLEKWENAITRETIKQLSEYFTWTRKHFTIPLMPHGTEFQKKAWKALEHIPYGETRNYLEEATMIGNPKAVRAIGWANHNNPIVIIIPCHRVIGKSGKLVGYGGWIERKKWLLEHESHSQEMKQSKKISDWLMI
jgi:AraC family transcriptional regulator, regulatory protein of adaptative response / methylated-DNA-[protein]-cysteine methyltransferase